VCSSLASELTEKTLLRGVSKRLGGSSGGSGATSEGLGVPTRAMTNGMVDTNVADPIELFLLPPLVPCGAASAPSSSSSSLWKAGKSGKEWNGSGDGAAVSVVMPVECYRRAAAGKVLASSDLRTIPTLEKSMHFLVEHYLRNPYRQHQPSLFSAAAAMPLFQRLQSPLPPPLSSSSSSPLMELLVPLYAQHSLLWREPDKLWAFLPFSHSPRSAFAFTQQRWEAERDGLYEQLAGKERTISRLKLRLQQAEEEANRREEVVAQLQDEVNASLVEWGRDRRTTNDTEHSLAALQMKVQQMEEEKVEQLARWKEEKKGWEERERALQHRMNAAVRRHEQEWSVLQEEVTHLTAETQEERAQLQAEGERRWREAEEKLEERTRRLQTAEQQLALLQQQDQERQRAWMEAKKEEKEREWQREASASKEEAERLRLQREVQQYQASLRVAEQQLQEMSLTATSSTRIIQALREELYVKEEEQQRLRDATVERVETFLREEETVKDGMLSQVGFWVKSREEMSQVVAAAEKRRQMAEEKAAFFQEVNDTLRQSSQEQCSRAAEDILEQHRWAAEVMEQLQAQQQTLLHRWREEEAKGVDLLSTVEVLTRIGEEQRQRQTAIEQDALHAKEGWKEALSSHWKAEKKIQRCIHHIHGYQKREKRWSRQLHRWQMEGWAMAKTLSYALGLSSTSTSPVPPLPPLSWSPSASSWEEDTNEEVSLGVRKEEGKTDALDGGASRDDEEELEGEEELEEEEEEEEEVEEKEEHMRREGNHAKRMRLSLAGGVSRSTAPSRIFQQTVSTANKRIARSGTRRSGKGGRIPAVPRRGPSQATKTTSVVREERAAYGAGDRSPEDSLHVSSLPLSQKAARFSPAAAAALEERNRRRPLAALFPSTASPHSHPPVPRIVSRVQHLMSFLTYYLPTVCQRLKTSEATIHSLTVRVEQMQYTHQTTADQLDHLRVAHEREMAAFHREQGRFWQLTQRKWCDAMKEVYITHWMGVFRGVPRLLSDVMQVVAKRLQREEEAAAEEARRSAGPSHPEASEAPCGGRLVEERGEPESRCVTGRGADAEWPFSPPPPAPLPECEVSAEVEEACEEVIKEIWGVEGGWQALHAFLTTAASPSPSSLPPPSVPTATPTATNRPPAVSSSSLSSSSSRFSASAFLRHGVASSFQSFQWAPTQWEEIRQFVDAAFLRHTRWPSSASLHAPSSALGMAGGNFVPTRRPYRDGDRQRIPFLAKGKRPLASLLHAVGTSTPRPRTAAPTTSTAPLVPPRREKTDAVVGSAYDVLHQRRLPFRYGNAFPSATEMGREIGTKQGDAPQRAKTAEGEARDALPTHAHFPEEEEEGETPSWGLEEGASYASDIPSSASTSASSPPLAEVPVLPSFLHPLLSEPFGGSPRRAPPPPLHSFSETSTCHSTTTATKPKQRMALKNEPKKTKDFEKKQKKEKDRMPDDELFLLLYRVVYQLVNNVLLEHTL